MCIQNCSVLHSLAHKMLIYGEQKTAKKNARVHYCGIKRCSHAFHRERKGH
uniref:Uncharacterized protein n=1 Tax=Anguilla anguilla TaxID=7936 RepID=A0A0E9WWT6_ANGAN